VLKLQDFIIKGSGILTLQGTATTNFIINVTNQFSLKNNATIALSGGVDWDNVLFNVHGSGKKVSITGHARLGGIVMATQRVAKVSGYARIDGEVIANDLIFKGHAQVERPPITSQ
jgi:choice-of-anchor A domain-containing protein